MLTPSSPRNEVARTDALGRPRRSVVPLDGHLDSKNENHAMTDTPLTFGLPNTLPPLTRRELHGCFVFSGMGSFVLLIGLFPHLRPHPRFALPMALCLLALPAWGLFRFLTRKPRTEVEARERVISGTSTQIGLFSVFMVSVGVGFFLWARHLDVASPVILGSLLIIEGLGGVIVSLTEWWRLSHIGVSFGLVAGGFLIPFVDKASMAVPVGGAFLVGSLLSAGILSLQLHHHHASPANRIA